MKIAIIGFGSIGKRHLENLIALGEYNIVVVSSHLSEANIKINSHLIPIVNNIFDVLDSIDAMVISNATNLHHEYLNIAVNNNIHSYLEKPIACNFDQINNIAKEAKNKGIVIAVGTQFRFNDGLIKIKDLINNNFFGRIISVVSSHGEHIADYHPEEKYQHSYAVNKEQCGGVLLTQVHHIDYLDWLFGPFTHTYANEMQIPSLEVNVETIVNYSLISYKTGLQIHGHMNYVQRPKSTTLSVIGELGSVFWNNEKCMVKSFTSEKNLREFTYKDRNTMFILSMRDFLNSIRLSKKPNVDLESGIRSLKIVDSIKRSMLSGSCDRIFKESKVI